MPVENLDAFFEPRSIGVMAESFAPGTHGGLVLSAISATKPNVPLALIGPVPLQTPFRAVPSLADLDEVPDLTVLTLPPRDAPAILSSLGGRGGRAAIVTQHDFHDTDLRRRLASAAKETGVRLLGPGSLGVQVPRASLNASLVQRLPDPGGLAVVTHSASMLAAVVGWAQSRKIGLSATVSVGAGLDVGLADLLDYLAQDLRTRAILLYLDRIESPRVFVSAARRAARAKPVIVLKAGRHEPAPPSLGLWRLPPDVVHDAVLRRVGCLRVDSVVELFDAAEFLARAGAKAQGNRIAIVSNSAGLASLAADHVLDRGLRLASPSAETLRQSCGGSHPVDLGAAAMPDAYARALTAVLGDPGADAAVVVHAANPFVDANRIADAIVDAAAAHDRPSMRKPVVVGWFADPPEAVRTLHERQVPVFTTPLNAVSGLAFGLAHRRAQDELMEMPPDLSDLFTPDPDATRKLLSSYVSEGRLTVTEQETLRVLQTYGLDLRQHDDEAELCVGIGDDPIFGPVVVLGVPGSAVASAVALPPLDLPLAQALLERAPAAVRLPVAEEWDSTLALLLVQIAQLAADCPAIREIRLALGKDESRWTLVRARATLERNATQESEAGDPARPNPRFVIRPYPRELEAWLDLKDGQRVRLRPVRPEDEALYPAFGEKTDPEDLRLRFFAPMKEASHAFVARLTQIDYAREMAFVAIDPETDDLLGVARLAADPDLETAEFAVIVRSDFKGRGLGWGLMQRIITYGSSIGLKRIAGEVLRENATMLRMAKGLGFETRVCPEDPSIVRLNLSLGGAGQSVDQR